MLLDYSLCVSFNLNFAMSDELLRELSIEK